MMWPQLSAWTWWSLALAMFILMMCYLYWSEIKSALKHNIGAQGRQFSADARPISFSFSVSEATGTATSPRRPSWGWIITFTACFVLIFGMYWFEKDSACSLIKELDRIDWAIGEKNVQHFEQELRGLYPSLGECGLTTPLIDPVKSTHYVYNDTWYEFHLTFLKTLRRQIRNNAFDLDQWNIDVHRENDKRKRALEEQ